MIGTMVGSYQVTEALAEGGMGAVFVARHSVMGRDAVIKLLKPELSHNAEMVRRFVNEAKAAASIHDPGIVQIFDVGTLPDNRAYIVMERMRGETLSQRLRTRGVSIEQAVHFLRLIARTLDAAHAHGIVHRDLKPDNLFLVPDRDIAGGERTKILDFGIAKLADATTQHATRAGSIFGTPAYMAPEQCNDTAQVDARADLYAVGCIAYEMLSGAPPFGGGGLELLAAHMRDTPVPMCQRSPGVPPWLGAVVDRLLKKSPADRYLSAADLYAALDPNAPQFVAATAHSIPPGGRASPMPSYQQTPVPPLPTPSFQTPVPPLPTPPPGSYAPAPAQPQMTTHTSAAGVITGGTQPPQARSKTPLILGVLAIAVAAAVTLVMVMRKPTGAHKRDVVAAQHLLDEADAAFRARNYDDVLVAASKVPADDPSYRQAQQLIAMAKRDREAQAALAELKTLAEAGKLADARAVLARIPRDSVYHHEAEQLLERVDQVSPSPSPVVVATRPAKSPKPERPTKGKGTPPPVPTQGSAAAPSPPPPPVDDDPPIGFDLAIMRARNAQAEKNWGVALRSAKNALKSARGRDEIGEARMIATKSACALNLPGVARSTMPSKDSGSWHSIAVEFCDKKGHSLD